MLGGSTHNKKTEERPMKFTHVAAIDMVGGHAQVMFNGMLATYPFVKDGKLKVLAVSSARRFGSAPEIPTVAELGPNRRRNSAR